MGFPGDGINMGVEIELVVQMNAKVFSRLHHFQDLAMDGVGKYTACNLDSEVWSVVQKEGDCLNFI